MDENPVTPGGEGASYPEPMARIPIPSVWKILLRDRFASVSWILLLFFSLPFLALSIAFQQREVILVSAAILMLNLAAGGCLLLLRVRCVQSLIRRGTIVEGRIGKSISYRRSAYTMVEYGYKVGETWYHRKTAVPGKGLTPAMKILVVADPRDPRRSLILDLYR